MQSVHTLTLLIHIVIHSGINRVWWLAHAYNPTSFISGGTRICESRKSAYKNRLFPSTMWTSSTHTTNVIKVCRKESKLVTRQPTTAMQGASFFTAHFFFIDAGLEATISQESSLLLNGRVSSQYSLLPSYILFSTQHLPCLALTLTLASGVVEGEMTSTEQLWTCCVLYFWEIWRSAHCRPWKLDFHSLKRKINIWLSEGRALD